MNIDEIGPAMVRYLVAALLVGPTLVGAAQSGRSLSSFTVPTSALPSGCALERPTSVSRGALTIVGAPDLEFPNNPWSGTDPTLVAAVRKAVDGTPAKPDVPPIATRGAAAPELKLTDGVLEAYHAVYVSAEGSRVVVFAITYNDVKLARDEPPAGVKPPIVLKDWANLTARTVKGATVVILSTATDRPSPCFDPIGSYIGTLK